MKGYATYSVEDFVTDESYLRYYYKENEEDHRFWTDWISRHPEKLDVIISADNYIDAFSIRLSETEFQVEQQRFADALEESLEDESPLYVAYEGDESFEEDLKPAIIAYQDRIRLKKMIILVIVLLLFSVTYFLLS